MNTKNRISMVESGESSTGSNEKQEHGHHPNSRANLKPWKKGMSGNPLGRPHKFTNFGKALTEVGVGYKETRRYDVPSGEYYIETDDITRREKVLHTIWDRAADGEIQYINILAHLGCLDDISENT